MRSGTSSGTQGDAAGLQSGTSLVALGDSQDDFGGQVLPDRLHGPAHVALLGGLLSGGAHEQQLRLGDGRGLRRSFGRSDARAIPWCVTTWWTRRFATSEGDCALGCTRRTFTRRSPTGTRTRCRLRRLPARPAGAMTTKRPAYEGQACAASSSSSPAGCAARPRGASGGNGGAISSAACLGLGRGRSCPNWAAGSPVPHSPGGAGLQPSATPGLRLVPGPGGIRRRGRCRSAPAAV